MSGDLDLELLARTNNNHCVTESGFRLEFTVCINTPVCLPVCLSVSVGGRSVWGAFTCLDLSCLSHCLPVCGCLSVCLWSVYLSGAICLSVCLSICLSGERLSVEAVCLSVCLSGQRLSHWGLSLCVCLCVCVPVCLSRVCLPVWRALTCHIAVCLSWERLLVCVAVYLTTFLHKSPCLEADKHRNTQSWKLNTEHNLRYLTQMDTLA